MPCSARITPQGGVSSYLGQPCTISLHEMPKLLQPAPDDCPLISPTSSGGWSLSTYSTLLYLPSSDGPWLHCRVPLRPQPEGVHVQDAFVECGVAPVRLGQVRTEMSWKTPLSCSRARFLLNTRTMDRASYAMGEPTSSTAEPFFSSLLPGSWPAAIVPAYDRHHFDIWVRFR